MSALVSVQIIFVSLSEREAQIRALCASDFEEMALTQRLTDGEEKVIFNFINLV